MEMDFEGMKLADQLLHWIINISGVIALIVGFGTQSVYNMWYAYFAGIAVCIAVTVPPWPFYQKHPLKWQKDVELEKKKK